MMLPPTVSALVVRCPRPGGVRFWDRKSDSSPCEDGTGTVETWANRRNPQVVQRISPVVVLRRRGHFLLPDGHFDGHQFDARGSKLTNDSVVHKERRLILTSDLNTLVPTMYGDQR